jgi:hypothetical protein
LDVLGQRLPQIFRLEKACMKKVLAFNDWWQPGYKAGGTITAF